LGSRPRDTRTADKPLQDDDVDFYTFIDSDAGVLCLFGRRDTHLPRRSTSPTPTEIDRFDVITQSMALRAAQERRGNVP
jgi:hypothetical protein